MLLFDRRATVGRRNHKWTVHLELTELDSRVVPAVSGASTAPLAATPTGAQTASVVALPVTTPFVPPASPLTATPLALPFGIAASFNAAAATTAAFPGLAANLPNLSSPASAAAATTSPASQPLFGPPASNPLLTNRDSGYAEPTDASPANPDQRPTQDRSLGSDLGPSGMAGSVKADGSLPAGAGPDGATAVGRGPAAGRY
jgi:hypothetical protein